MTKREQWFRLIAEQQQSSYSIISFCAARDIKLSTFHYWRKKYKQAANTGTGSFIALSLPAAQRSSIRIAYPNGVDIHLPAADLTLIAQLLRLA